MAMPLPPEDRLRYLRVIGDHSEPMDMLGFAILILFISVLVVIYLARHEGLVWVVPTLLLANVPAVMFWNYHCRHRELGAELLRKYKNMPDEELAARYQANRARANWRLALVAAMLGVLILWLVETGRSQIIIGILLN